jgi:hypothetical protein
MCPAQTAFSPVRRLKAANARRAGRLGYRNPIIAQHGIPWIKASRLELASIRTDPISNLQPVMGESSSAPATPSLTIAAPESRRKIWGPTTSGPFYTGTAEVEPMGSWYLEPYLFDSSHGGSSSKEFNQKMAIGMGHNLEFDIQTPMILNTAKSPTTPMGKTVSQFGTGDTHMNFKYELTKDADTCKFLAQPAMTLTFDFIIPSGNASGLRASRYGVDQFGNGTYQEGLSLLIRKRARPFMFYGQFGDLIGDPTTVSKGYVFNNGIGSVQSGRHVRMVDGNLLYYSAALEYVLNTRHGIGLLAELDGQSQSGHSLFFGKATAPSYSYLSAAPEVEFTWPARKNLAITWGAGVNLPVERGDYPRTVTPMFTVSFNFNGPNGGRSSQ